MCQTPTSTLRLKVKGQVKNIGCRIKGEECRVICFWILSIKYEGPRGKKGPTPFNVVIFGGQIKKRNSSTRKWLARVLKFYINIWILPPNKQRQMRVGK